VSSDAHGIPGETTMSATQKVFGHVLDVVEPVQRRDDDDQFFGFIMSEQNEKLYFQSRDVRCRRPLQPREVKHKVVTFDVVPQNAHSMRKAVNIDLLSEAAE
jgi:hypothetical protein